MQTAYHSTERPPLGEERDQFVLVHGLSWEAYEQMLAICGDDGGVRLSYLEGTLQLMSPSRAHELTKKALARLLEAYTEELDLELTGVGSWTVKKKSEQRGVEPDECYMIGAELKDAPDLAIDVIYSSGGLDKLEVYRGLGVQEVWLWRANKIEIFGLEVDGYQLREQSGLLPQIDTKLLCRLIQENRGQLETVKKLRAHLRNPDKLL